MLGLLGLTLTLVLVRAAVAGGGNAPVPTVVATGFAWAENILCEPSVGDVRGNGTLWVSESTRGELWRVTYDEGRRAWTQALHYSAGARRVAGLARDPSDAGVYALVQPESGNCALMRINKTQTDTATKVAVLPRKCLGDGLAYDNRTQTFFAANEGDFLPYNGKVYSIDRRTGTVEEIAKDGGPYTSTDGAAYDAVTGQLFVSEVYASALLRIDPARKTVEKLKAPKGVEGIDDFCVAEDDTNLIHGASPLNGKVFRWNMSSDVVQFFGEDLTFPTSVRAGCRGLGLGGYFVTEGGGMNKNDTDRRVLWFARPR